MKSRFYLGTLSAALLLATPLAADAQMKAAEWQFRATVYGWFPAISGTTEFPPTGASGPSFKVDADTVIEHLKFALMGTFEAQKGEWGVWTDVFYSDIGGTTSGTRNLTVGGQPLPATVTANLSLDAKTWIWTIAGTYSIMSTPEHSMEALFGARMVDVKETLNWGLAGNFGSLGTPGAAGRTEVTMTNWDAVVGIKGRVSFGDERRWFMPYYLDIGTGQSKFTWQAFLGAGYAFKWGSVVAAWRYLDYETEPGDPIQNVNFSGPMLGLAFHW